MYSTRYSNIPPQNAQQYDHFDNGYTSHQMREYEQLRDKVRSVQEQLTTTRKVVRTKEVQLQKLKHECLPSEDIIQEKEKLNRVQGKVRNQENRLRKLREMQTNIKHQHLVNSELSAELDSLRTLLENKQREIAETDNIIADINRTLKRAQQTQYDEEQRHTSFTDRITQLKQEMHLHKKLANDVQQSFSAKRDEVRKTKEETDKVDAKIAELWRKLQQAKQNQQSAAKIAAVTPFDPKPSGKAVVGSAADKVNDVGSWDDKPEIDIKLIERHGGSGQSSPSISADEREPFRPAKPANLNLHRSAFTKPQSNTESLLSPRHQRSEAIGHDNVFEPPANLRKDLSDVPISVTIEQGPKLRRPTSASPVTTQITSIPPGRSEPESLTNKQLKNFNRVPKPFGVNKFSTFLPPKPNGPAQPSSEHREKDKPSIVPVPGSRTSQTSGNGAVSSVDSSRLAVDLTSPTHKQTSPRYATRSQISNTYISQVDPARLEQYKRDLENAIKNTDTTDSPPLPVPHSEQTTDVTSDIQLQHKDEEEILVEGGSAADTSLTVLSAEVENTASTSSSGDTSPRIQVIENEKLQLTRKVTSILRSSRGSDSKRSGNARFHPLVILLDVALNGSLEEVKEILPKVPNPSASNDEGITALHNAICAGHMDIVKCLTEYGVDVNAVDTDGWTPLHCAASCNNAPIVGYLSTHGASVLATTYSDQQTACEKCEEDEDGFAGTSKLLTEFERDLGVKNSAVVFAVYSYESQAPDELSISEGDKLTVLRRGDQLEENWWFCKNDRAEQGYVAKNLLSFAPRMPPKFNPSAI